MTHRTDARAITATSRSPRLARARTSGSCQSDTDPRPRFRAGRSGKNLPCRLIPSRGRSGRRNPRGAVPTSTPPSRMRSPTPRPRAFTDRHRPARPSATLDWSRCVRSTRPASGPSPTSRRARFPARLGRAAPSESSAPGSPTGWPAAPSVSPPQRLGWADGAVLRGLLLGLGVDFRAEEHHEGGQEEPRQQYHRAGQ